ncbi:MAG: tRNA guanosine(34) transglycosylase Tgt [Desulfobacterales bacterium]
MFRFELIGRDAASQARAGRMETAHGVVETPAFMPVGTQGSVKSLSPEELEACGVQILLGNTYHLHLRPGEEVIRRLGGLHRFMHWARPILTDSGGFQVFSLAALARISEEGVRFRSHLDGSERLLTPEGAVAIQLALGADVLMCLDRVTGWPATAAEIEAAERQTLRWAERCRRRWRESGEAENRALFGIVQGGMDRGLRRRSAEDLAALDLSGYAVGGLSVGEPLALMLTTAAETLPLLPADRPRYVMGVGRPEDLLDLICLGADLFDCVLPTRNARNGQLFTSRGTVQVTHAAWREEAGPADPECSCYTCRHYSLAYLRHLFLSRELLAYRLNTLHNVHYFVRLVRSAREAILRGEYAAFRNRFYRRREI